MVGGFFDTLFLFDNKKKIQGYKDGVFMSLKVKFVITITSFTYYKEPVVILFKYYGTGEKLRT